MSERDAFAKRGRSLEEEYFRKNEQELIEKLRRRAAAEAELQQLGENAGVADEEILKHLRELGYTPETVMLLHLVPLVQMAWAEGGVSDRERELIVEAARARGVEAGSPADRQLAEWLTSRPSEQLFDQSLRAVRAFLQARPAEEREASQRDLLADLTAIASASGGLFGFGAVSPEERARAGARTGEARRRRRPVRRITEVASDNDVPRRRRAPRSRAARGR
jgi:hypothetical protein